MSIHSVLKLLNDPYFRYEMEPHFELSMVPNEILCDRMFPRLSISQMPASYHYPWGKHEHRAISELANDQKLLHLGTHGFHACVDVHHFDPNEITVKTVGNTIIVEANHEERGDEHGSIERHFVRKYVLPTQFDTSTVHSTLSADGVLTIKAPPPPVKDMSEHPVPIAHIEAPAVEDTKDKGNKPAFEETKDN